MTTVSNHGKIVRSEAILRSINGDLIAWVHIVPDGEKIALWSYGYFLSEEGFNEWRTLRPVGSEVTFEFASGDGYRRATEFWGYGSRLISIDVDSIEPLA